MAKRFTDTDKWKKMWYRELGSQGRDIFNYVVENCDHAGIWEINLALMSFQIGETMTINKIKNVFKNDIVEFDDKVFIPSFIEFQYGQIRDNNAVHNSIIKKLKQYGLDHLIKVESGFSNRPSAIRDRLSKKKKLEIMALEKFACSYCGKHGDETTLFIDHIWPVSSGGENIDENLTSACMSCNSKKRDTDALDFVIKHKLEDKISQTLKDKLEFFIELKGAFKELTSPKDKEEEKEEDKYKYKVMEKEKEKERSNTKQKESDY